MPNNVKDKLKLKIRVLEDKNEVLLFKYNELTEARKSFQSYSDKLKKRLEDYFKGKSKPI